MFGVRLEGERRATVVALSFMIADGIQLVAVHSLVNIATWPVTCGLLYYVLSLTALPFVVGLYWNNLSVQGPQTYAFLWIAISAIIFVVMLIQSVVEHKSVPFALLASVLVAVLFGVPFILARAISSRLMPKHTGDV